MAYQFYFQKFHVWQQSMDMVTRLYEITMNFPKSEKYVLVNQIRRAAVSIPTNIAEGLGKKGFKDQARFTSISYGSLMELLTLLTIAKNLKYISNQEFIQFEFAIENIARQLNSLRNSQMERVK